MLDRSHYFILTFIGLFTGFFIYLIDQNIASEKVQHFDAHFMSLVAISLMLGWRDEKWWQVFVGAVVIALPVASLMTYLEFFLRNANISYGYVESSISLLRVLLIASFYIFLIFYLVYAERRRCDVDYQALFEHAWNTPFMLFIACVFTSLAAGILALWALMFMALGIELFKNVFTQQWFVLSMFGGLMGMGIAIARVYWQWVEKLRNIFQTICKILLVPLQFVLLGFMASVPFARTDFNDLLPLFIFIPFVIGFFFNAVFQEGPEQAPYPQRFLNRLTMVTLVVLPVLPLCALIIWWRGLFDPGLTMADSSNGLFIVIALCYSFGYAIAVFTSKSAWMNWVKVVNVRLAWLFAFLFLILSAPGVNLLSLTSWLNQRFVSVNEMMNVSDNVFFYRSNFRGQDFSGRDVSNIVFSQADLSQANLSNIKANQTDFSGANLQQANLRGANLSMALFDVKTDFTGANLTDAVFSEYLLFGLENNPTLKNACGKPKQLKVEFELKPC